MSHEFSGKLRFFRTDNSSFFTGFETRLRLPVWLHRDANFASCNSMSCGGAFNILLHYAGNGLITIRLRDASSFTRFVASGCCATDRELICAVMATMLELLARQVKRIGTERRRGIPWIYHALLRWNARKSFWGLCKHLRCKWTRIIANIIEYYRNNNCF